MVKLRGLTSEEAARRLAKEGPNEIREVNHVSLLRILFHQIQKNFIIYLLVVALLIAVVVGKTLTAYVLAGVILTVVIVGLVQEYKAEQAINNLKKMIMPLSVVIRDGQEIEVPSTALVRDDVVVLRTGERVPADCRLLFENNLRVNEAVLTGESTEVSKKVAQSSTLRDENMLFMGSFVVSGRCLARVVATGMNTRFGKIARLISTTEKVLPLQDKVNRISKYMVIVAVTVSVLTGIVILARTATFTPEVLTNVLILVIAMAVSAFPEGFPVVLITTLAIGVHRMAKQNAIVNRMSIIETLGETTVICADKTGTITKGEMTVKEIITPDERLEVEGVGFEAEGRFMANGEVVNVKSNHKLRLLLKAVVLCNDAVIERTGEDMTYRIIGSATEGALLILAAKAHLFKEDLLATRKAEIPFTSERKLMSVLIKERNKSFVYVKGAPERVLERASFIYAGDHIRPMTEEDKKRFSQINEALTMKALRTLAIAFKEVNSQLAEYTEDHLVFLGLIGMEDPPREEVAEALSLARSAGITVKMITGDNPLTALAVAQQVGINGPFLTGDDIDQLNDRQLKKLVKTTAVFARVRPEHKLRIVKTLKSLGEIVTMTGDGVNDAPALKEAHIGVAMGQNGTDVTRSVADITLKDDNFATIVIAVREGRGIFNNMRKFVTYQLSCNFAELFILFIGVLLAPFLGWQTPVLLAIQILFMNLVTDNLPAITLGFNRISRDIMEQKPRARSDILNGELLGVVIFNGILMGLLTLLVYGVSLNFFGQSAEISRTVALVALILLEIAGAFHFRSFRHRILESGLFSNRYLVAASIVSILATFVIIYSPLSIAFETYHLKLSHWIVPLLVAFIYLVLLDGIKTVNNRTRRFLREII